MSGLKWKHPHAGIYEGTGGSGIVYLIEKYAGQFWMLSVDGEPAPGWNQFSMLRNAKARAERMEETK